MNKILNTKRQQVECEDGAVNEGPFAAKLVSSLASIPASTPAAMSPLMPDSIPGSESSLKTESKSGSGPKLIPATIRINRPSGVMTLKVSLDPQSMIDAAKQVIAQQFKRCSGEFIKPSLVKEFLLLNMAPCEREVFACLFLDNYYRLIAFEPMFYGSIRHAQVTPREIIKRALQLNAAALMVAHNHPSGSFRPSSHDKHMTKDLYEALQVVDIELLDHFIVGGKAVLSMAEEGLLDWVDDEASVSLHD